MITIDLEEIFRLSHGFMPMEGCCPEHGHFVWFVGRNVCCENWELYSEEIAQYEP